MAEEIVVFGGSARFADLALVNGAVGIVVAPRGQLLRALVFAIEDSKIVGYEIIADARRLQRLDVAVLACAVPQSC